MVKLLLVCLTALFGVYVEGTGPCDPNLAAKLKRYTVFPLSGVAGKDMNVKCATNDYLNKDLYNIVIIHFGDIIENKSTLVVSERMNNKVQYTSTIDMYVYVADSTGLSRLENYPGKNDNSTIFSIECDESTGVLLTHYCGHGTGNPTLLISNLKDEPIPKEVFQKCQKIAEKLAGPSAVVFYTLDGRLCSDNY